MRFLLINVVTVGLMLFSAASASAISFFFNNESATTLLPGDTFSIQLRMDTEGESQITSVFVSVSSDASVFAFTGGTSPGQILFNTSTFEGIARVSQPFVLSTDPAGNIRAASFAALSPSNVSATNQLLATLNFDVLDPGTTVISVFIATGDDVTVNGVSMIGDLTFVESVEITVIPEPGTALLMGLGLAGLAAAGRRRMP